METGAPIFVGRDSERAHLDQLWGLARDGRGSPVLIDGAAGFGKTALAADLAARVRAEALLRATAEADERHLSYGVLAQLLRGWPGVLSPVLAQIAADGTADLEPLAVGQQLLALFDSLVAAPVSLGPGATGDGPSNLLLITDDVNHADLDSVRALVFALRRSERTPVLALLTSRTEQTALLPASLRRLVDDLGTRITLGGLDARQIQVLARKLGHGELALADATRLVAHTGGSPLLIDAVLDELGRTGERLRSGVPVPVPAEFAQIVRAQLSQCPPEAAALVEAVSLLSVPRPLHLVSAVAEVSDPLPAVDAATKAQLLGPVAGDRLLRLRHPLVRPAVYGQLPTARRVRLHQRAAQLLDATEPDAALRQRIAAAIQPDDVLAEQAEEYGLREFVHGRWSAAGLWLGDAHRLSPPGAGADRRLAQLVEALALAADSGQVPDLSRELRERRGTALGTYLAARLSSLRGDLRQARRLASEAWSLAQADTSGSLVPELPALIAAELGRVELTFGRADAAARWAGTALTLASSPWVAVDIPGTLLLAEALAGRRAAALARVEWLPPTIDVPTATELDALTARGLLSMWAGDLHRARIDLETVSSGSHRLGTANFALVAVAYLSELYYRLGEWDAAITEAETGLALALDLDHRRALPLLCAAAANPRAARGEFERARTYATRAQDAAAAVGDVQSRLWAGVARARLAESEGDLSAAMVGLDPLVDPGQLGGRDGVRELALQPWQPLGAAALHASGRGAEAVELLDEVDRIALSEGLAAIHAQVFRVRAEIAVADGDLDTAVTALDRAVELCPSLSDRLFESARLDLVRGQVGRLRGQRREAGAHLSRALRAFEALGARPWAQRSENELRRCGQRRARAAHQRTLTPAESTVAKLAREGLSNGEIATQLLLSIKTVEFHLSNVYAKLGVRSRSQLIARQRDEPGMANT